MGSTGTSGASNERMVVVIPGKGAQNMFVTCDVCNIKVKEKDIVEHCGTADIYFFQYTDWLSATSSSVISSICRRQKCPLKNMEGSDIKQHPKDSLFPYHKRQQI